MRTHLIGKAQAESANAQFPIHPVQAYTMGILIAACKPAGVVLKINLVPTK